MLLSVGVLLALWTTSGYVAAFEWAASEISGERVTRGWLRGLAVRLGLALLIAVLLAFAAMVVVFAGPFAQWLGDLLGIGEAAIEFWTVAQWPFFLAVAVVVNLFLYRAAPREATRRIWDDLVGSCCGVAIWLVASAIFSFYLANFASYNRVYGALGHRDCVPRVAVDPRPHAARRARGEHGSGKEARAYRGRRVVSLRGQDQGIIGGPRWNRTNDLGIKSPLLYQLS